MKATGIVRRIDDLGRVVIPKEIRRTLRIREGEPLEIYTERDGSVIFKKYSPMGEIGSVSEEVADSVCKTLGKPCAVCDRDAVIAVSGLVKRDVVEKGISRELEDKLSARKSFVATIADEETVMLTENDGNRVIMAVPVIADGEMTGSIVVLSENDTDFADEIHTKVMQTAAQFLSKRMSM